MLRLESVWLCKSLLGGKVLFVCVQVSTGWKGFVCVCVCVCVKRTVVAVSKETDSHTERIKRIEED